MCGLCNGSMILWSPKMTRPPAAGLPGAAIGDDGAAMSDERPDRPTLLDRLPADPDPDAVLGVLQAWTGERGIRLYPAQEEALLELATGSNVILSTPTGTGKSLVALGAHL